MLRYPLLHPGLLAGLASAGHGSQILIGDGNYPFRTASGPRAEIVYLNLRPGLLTVVDVLETLRSAVVFEAATVMQPESGDEPEIFGTFSELLPGLDIERTDRADFYRQARSGDVAVMIATGEQRLYANILLTIGLVSPSPESSG